MKEPYKHREYYRVKHPVYGNDFLYMIDDNNAYALTEGRYWALVSYNLKALREDGAMLSSLEIVYEDLESISFETPLDW